MSDDQRPDNEPILSVEPRRDERGRFVKGASGNPAGRPAGIMTEAARIAAAMLTERAPELIAAAIERALSGRDLPLKYCLDRIIAPQRDQPIVWGDPANADVTNLADLMTSIAAAAAVGTINPSQAVSLCQAFADLARAIGTDARSWWERVVAEAPAIWSRMQLRACVALADGVREVRDEAGEVDKRIPDLCDPILQVGRRALVQLAQIGDRAELILGDEAFVAEHPEPPKDATLHPLAAEMLPLWKTLEGYLDKRMDRLDARIEERFASRETAGEPDPIYRAWIFMPVEERLRRFNPEEKPT